jgi:BCD family chlorophyll transporter-like MFS transporter
MTQDNFSWPTIIRLGLVQASLGAIVVLTTSTLNRVMAVELALPAMLPGALVTLHHLMQVLRPRMGHGSDLGQRRTPWIVGGMAALAVGGALAALATTLMADRFALGLGLNVAAFTLIGVGVSSTGTSLLVLMAKRVASERRAAAATVVWIMMIASFAITATLAGKLLDPYSPARLVAVAAGVSALALLVSLVACWGVEGPGPGPEAATEPEESRPDFRAALRQVWSEPDARRFTLFILLSMLAYSAQDLILEPFAGAVFAFSPGESTGLSGVQHGGAVAGMLLVAAMTTLLKGTPAASLKLWVVVGCVGSALAMGGLVTAGLAGAPWPLKQNVFLMGLANGTFSIAAIGGMMTLASQGRRGREGVRMGLWGASQAMASAAGGFLGTVLADGARALVGASGRPYAFVFGLEALGFLAATWLALSIRFGKPAEQVAPDAVEA